MTAADGSTPDRTIALDAHVHTEASHDCSTAPERVVEAALDAGLDAVAVTDHDVTDGAHRTVAAAEGTPLLVVPGVEVSTADGHLLALGVDEAPAPDRSFRATVERVRDAGGVAVVPHPFQVSRHGVRKAAIEDCDGIEVVNAVAVTGAQNRRARRFAAAEDRPAIGGSDAHTPDLIGRGVTTVDLPAGVDPTAATVADVLAGIREGETSASGTVTTPPEFVRTYAWHARSTAATAADSGRTAVASHRTAVGAGAFLAAASLFGTPDGVGRRAATVGRAPLRIASLIR